MRTSICPTHPPKRPAQRARPSLHSPERLGEGRSWAMRVTLDWNQLIDIHEGSGDIEGLHQLIALQSEGALRFCIPAIQASEKQRDGTTLDSYSKFRAFAESLGLGDYEELKPPLYIGMAYIGHCVIHGTGMERLERQIHDILFPNVRFSYPDHLAELGPRVTQRHRESWRNAKCDVLSMWSHIHYDADIFVTTDRDFHKASKKPRLIALGAGQICTPSECVSAIEGTRP